MNILSKGLKIVVVIILIVVLGLIAFWAFKGKPTRPNDEVRVYFSKLVGSDVQVEPVARKLGKGEDALSLALAELIKGPSEKETDKGFYSEIPEGTRVIEVKQEPDAVRINMNKHFAYGGGSNSIVIRLKELVYTALDAEPIRPVYLDIDGEQIDVMGGEGLEVMQPLSKDNFPADVKLSEEPEGAKTSEE